ncbi:MAG: hypothetical protein M1827_006883 [Pycnora praestabilis]|nr:MAG: hypothetical protein M1827_006883 [Pycnora praestabilis]
MEEAVLSGSMINGLARPGFTSQLQGSMRMVNDTDNDMIIDRDYWLRGKGNIFIVNLAESQHWVRLGVHTTLEGCAYNMRGAALKTAVGMLLIHCVLASTQKTYAIVSSFSSTSWGFIAEVTALAVNSSPMTKLRNTCDGITR